MDLSQYNFLTWHRRDDLSFWLVVKTIALAFLLLWIFVGLTVVWFQLGL